MTIPDQQMLEITCLLNGAQASRRLMLQFTKFDKDIQEYPAKKRIARGSKKHVIKKILKAHKKMWPRRKLMKKDLIRKMEKGSANFGV
jgi:hypothetical protein